MNSRQFCHDNRVSGFAVIVVVAHLTLSGARARAAELFYMDHDLLTTKYVGAVGPLVMSGEIEAGDRDRLLTKIAADRDRFMQQNKIILASNGGDVVEAMKIAALLQSLFTDVSVGPLTGPCVGACFLIYVAAVERATDGEHLIGLQSMPQARAFLTVNTLPAQLQAIISRLQDDTVYWLTPRDEESLGVKSPAFHRYLATQCGWDDVLERDVYSGRRPFNDATPMLTCRASATRSAAYKALDVALKRAQATR